MFASLFENRFHQFSFTFLLVNLRLFTLHHFFDSYNVHDFFFLIIDRRHLAEHENSLPEKGSSWRNSVMGAGFMVLFELVAITRRY